MSLKTTFLAATFLASLASVPAIPDAFAGRPGWQVTDPSRANYAGPVTRRQPGQAPQRATSRLGRFVAKMEANRDLQAYVVRRDLGAALDALRVIHVNGGSTTARIWGGRLAAQLDRAGRHDEAAEARRLIAR